MKRADFGKATRAHYWPQCHHYPLVVRVKELSYACGLLWGANLNHFVTGHAEAAPVLTGPWPHEIEWNW